MKRLLAPGDPWPHEGAAVWWTRARALLPEAETSFEAAMLGGMHADRIGYAFAGGYAAALWALLGDRDRTRAAALCVTEAAGNHPRSIEARIEGDALSGEKTFVTLGELAQDLYVLARVGEQDGRPVLALVRVDAAAEGVTLTPHEQTPFIPEIGHASVRLEAVRGFERLPGDGWSDYVRPFRTVEDVHVHVALVSHLVACGARWGWERGLLQRGLALLAALESLSRAEPSDPGAQLALAGVLEAGAGFVESAGKLEWPAQARERWDRDRALLNVAAKAREARTAKAWQRGASGPQQS